MDTASRYIGNEEQLQNHLKNNNWAGDRNQEAWFVQWIEVQCTRNDTERRVNEYTECRDTQQNVIEVASLLTTEFQLWNTENEMQFNQC